MGKYIYECVYVYIYTHIYIVFSVSPLVLCKLFPKLLFLVSQPIGSPGVIPVFLFALK